MQVVMSVLALISSFANLTEGASLTSEPFFALVLLGLELP